MNDDIKSHEIPESLVLEAKHVGKVGTIIKGGVSLGNVVLILVAIVENDGCNSGNAGANVEGIFESGVPVLALVDAVVVGLSEFAEGLAGENTH